ncbi:arrestin domain-containing protein 3-like [Salvelinus alpinus]|uniref:arrestin domain-containing protein 3-like n=1 Tax=Salvelinus alpinus TaxID=8036 RepID=UPI0039FCA6DB
MFGETFKNFTIYFNANNPRVTFSSGDFMAGQISFDLSKETKLSSITLTLNGKAKVQWTTQGGGGERRGRRRRQRRVHSARLEFFNFSQIVMQENNVVPNTTLQPGTHVYPFTCQIPQGNFPSSFHGVHGSIIYSMKVEIHRPWHLAKEFVTEFNFASHIDANQPHLLAPLAGSNTKTLCCLWCASGPISMTVCTERKGFVPGEMVKIICELSNGSSRIVTPHATLIQKQMFYTHNKCNRRLQMKNLASVDGQPVNPSSSEVYSDMMLLIPPNTTLTISNCPILELDYTVDVSLRIRGSTDLKVLFPIVLCNIPVYAPQPPPPYQ